MMLLQQKPSYLYRNVIEGHESAARMALHNYSKTRQDIWALYIVMLLSRGMQVTLGGITPTELSPFSWLEFLERDSMLPGRMNVCLGSIGVSGWHNTARATLYFQLD